MSSRVLMGLRIGLLLVLLSSSPHTIMAAPLTVIDVRGGQFKTGQILDSAASIELKEGERMTVIAPDGKSITLRGPHNGVPFPGAMGKTDPKQALAALVATRDARTSSIGVIRAGTHAVKIPQPWYLDVTRPGARCLRDGDEPIWWRPTTKGADSFSLFPVDLSWRADFKWESGQAKIDAPSLSRLDGQTLFLVRYDQREFGISIHTIPRTVDSPLVLTSWMLEKGCIQQADALINSLRNELDSAK